MNTERIKEIQNETAFPDSVSVCQALLKVWNETEQEQLKLHDVSKSVCLLNRKFHECEVHRCSAYGCLNCGQYK